jgi:hypothetical protein
MADVRPDEFDLIHTEVVVGKRGWVEIAQRREIGMVGLDETVLLRVEEVDVLCSKLQAAKEKIMRRRLARRKRGKAGLN